MYKVVTIFIFISLQMSEAFSCRTLSDNLPGDILVTRRPPKPFTSFTHCCQSPPGRPALTSQVYLPNTSQGPEQAHTFYAHLTAGPLLRTLPPLPVSWSVVTAAVRPTPEEPRPVVGMARGAVQSTYRSSWDLATDGSPVTGRGSGDSRNPPPPALPASAAFLAQILTQQKYIVTDCSCNFFSISLYHSWKNRH